MGRPLDVVLTSQGVDTGPGMSEISGDKGEIGQANDAISALNMLSNAKTVEDHRRLVPSVQPGRGTYICRRQTGQPFRSLRDVGLNKRSEFFEALHTSCDVVLINHALIDDRCGK
ncbi:Uncharacterised protein [Mycobacteroides abscessus subsp. abscessus]|nr:Uncharacterised protein [Mycobacteroides abscessus subsp. abscessus]SLJ03479.1 Uncharacterised protein [Mycobacteroides abscessus subsp. massiliense]